jgi:mono/diheme cytochrome c family protein
MNRCILGGGLMLMMNLVTASIALAADDGTDLAAETRTIFAARCANCHGPNLAKPKGRFGYVLDLARVAGNREMIVPGEPDQSELWELVQRGEMPPADSPTGPLSQEQKAVIRAWIAVGAPPPKPKDQNVSPPGQPAAPAEISVPSMLSRLSGRLGAFHLLIIHFPIPLFITAAAREFWGARQREHAPSPTVRWCVRVGAAGALAAAVLGWLYAWSGQGAAMPEVLFWHRWIGTAAAAFGAATAMFSEWQLQQDARSCGFRACLIATSALVTVASHLGGMLVHGQDFLGGG